MHAVDVHAWVVIHCELKEIAIHTIKKIIVLKKKKKKIKRGKNMKIKYVYSLGTNSFRYLLE